jgi:hypothetical protein
VCAEFKFLNVKTPTPVGRGLHGQAGATGVLTLGVDFHRGVDLSTALDLEAHAGAFLAELIRASIKGGVSLRAAGQFQAGLPLDLFSETGGGLIALLRVQAEAAGFVEATVGANGALLADEVAKSLPGPFGELLHIFLEELNVDVGLWAHAGVCAQLVAEAEFTGRLLPVDNAGFSFSVQFAAGWYYGYGLNYIANFTFGDTRRMLNRTSTLISNLLLAEAERYVASLPPGSAQAASQALPYLRVLTPAATRALFELGAQLATTDSSNQAAIAVRSVLDSLVSQAQQMALNAIVDLGITELDRWIASDGVIQRFLTLTEQFRREAIRDLTKLSQALAALDALTQAQPEDWLDALIGVLAVLEKLATSALMPAEIRPTIDSIWAAARLVKVVVPWLTGNNERPDPFGSPDAVDISGAEPAAERVAAALGVSADALPPAELVNFIVDDVKPMARLGQAVPEVAEALAWIGTLTGCDPDELFLDILRGAGSLTQATIEERFEALAAAAAVALSDQVLPHLLDPIIAQADPQMRTFLEQMARPTLVALPAVILPRIGDLGTDDAGTRIGEAISGVLLQTSSHFVLHALDTLTDHWITEGAPDIERIANEVEALGRTSPFFSAIAGATAGAFVGIDVQPGDVRDVLRLAAHAMRVWNEKQRHATIEATRVVLDLGLRLGGNTELDILLTSDAPPNLADLTVALEQVADGAWVLVTDPILVEACLLAPLIHARNQGETIVNVVRVIVAEVKKGIKAALAAFDTWEAQIAELGRRAESLAGETLHELDLLAHHVKDLVDTTLTKMHDFAVAILNDVVEGIPEPLRSVVRGPAVAVFETVWKDSAEAITAPLDVLVQIADWVDGTLGALLRSGSTDVNTVNAQIRDQIFAQEAPTITVPLLVPNPFFPLPPVIQVGTASVPAAGLLGVLADVVLGDSEVQTRIGTAVAKTRERLDKESQKRTLQNATAAHYTPQQAETARTVLDQKLVVHVSIPEPANRSVHYGPVQVTVRAEGADADYCNHPVLNMPERLRILVNDRELDTHGRWRQDGTAMTYSFLVIPPVNDDPPKKTPWAEEAWHNPDPLKDPFHRLLWRAIGVAGINTVTVACLDAPAPPETVTFALPMPKRADLLNYNRDTGDGICLSIAADGMLNVTNPGQTGPWTAIAAGRFVTGAKSAICCYNATSGLLRWFTMDKTGALAAANQRTVGTGWTHLASGHYLGRVMSEMLLYNAATGTSALWAPDPAGGPGDLVDQPDLGTGWSLLTSGPFGSDPRDRILLYRSIDGAAETRVADTAQTLQPDQTALALGTGWTHVVPGNFGGPTRCDLFCLDQSTGKAQLWGFSPTGALVPLGDPTPPGTPGTALLAAGDFFHIGGNDLLWAWIVDFKAGLFLRPEPNDPKAIFPGSAQLPLNTVFTDALTGRFV